MPCINRYLKIGEVIQAGRRLPLIRIIGRPTRPMPRYLPHPLTIQAIVRKSAWIDIRQYLATIPTPFRLLLLHLKLPRIAVTLL